MDGGDRPQRRRRLDLAVGGAWRSRSGPTSSSPPPATCRRSRRSRRPRSCARSCRSWRSASSTSSICSSSTASPGIPHRMDDDEFERLFTARPPGHLQFPRLPVRHPPAHLQARQPAALPRPRLRRGGHDHHPVRHAGAQPDQPLSPGDRGAAARRRRSPRAPRRSSSATSGSCASTAAIIEEEGVDPPEIRDWSW